MFEDAQLDPLSGESPVFRPAVSYLLCSTPRTGSSLLCDALRATGVAGRPEEYFQFRARTGQPRRALDTRPKKCYILITPIVPESGRRKKDPYGN